MKKVLIGMAMVALLGFATFAATEGTANLTLDISTYLRITANTPIGITISPGESGGEGSATFNCAGNVDYQVTGSLSIDNTIVTGYNAVLSQDVHQDDYAWAYSFVDFAGNGEEWRTGTWGVWPDVILNNQTLLAPANQPTNSDHTVWVGVCTWTFPDGQAASYPGYFKAGTYTGSTLTLTIAAQP